MIEIVFAPKMEYLLLRAPGIAEISIYRLSGKKNPVILAE